jgi:Skp family chaperone for outer membrane proteins
MIAELQNLQASTKALAASLQKSATERLQNGTAQLQNQIPPNVQQIYNDYSATLNENVNQMRNIVSEDIPTQEKVKKLVQEVNNNIQPLLEKMGGNLSWLKSTPPPSPSGQANGEATTS